MIMFYLFNISIFPLYLNILHLYLRYTYIYTHKCRYKILSMSKANCIYRFTHVCIEICGVSKNIFSYENDCYDNTSKA